MAESDRASQIQSAQRIGRKEGEILKLISLVQKKILKNKTLPTELQKESEEDTKTTEQVIGLNTENSEINEGMIRLILSFMSE